MGNLIKFTELGKSYWNNSGVYQKEYDELYKKFVPASGSTETLNGELIRAISRLYYEYCNNGNSNACDTKIETVEYTCHYCGRTGEPILDEDGNETGEFEMPVCEDCGGSGVIEEEENDESSINEFYNQFLELIETSIPEAEEMVEQVKNIITSGLYGDPDQFSDIRMDKYNKLTDLVIHYVLNNEDKELPDWYTRD